MLDRLAGLLPIVSDASPILSPAIIAFALAGWHRAQRLAALGRSAERGDHTRETDDGVHQLREAMQLNTEGMFLLRAVRDPAGAIADFEIRDVNPSGARLLRAESHVLVGRRLRRDFPASIRTGVFERYVEAIASRTPFTEDIRVSRRLFSAGWLHHQSVPTGDGVAVTLRDITAHKREEARLRRASLTDDLTQLYNRRGFLTLADQHLRIARRQGKDAVLMYVDMDEFKALNDQHGHAEGDRALAAVGRLLRRSVRDCDVVARIGGDEFTLVALDADRVAARIIQQRIEAHLALLNASRELAAPLSLTIGHTRVRPTDHASVTELLGRADALLYERKRRRKLMAAVRNGAQPPHRRRVDRQPVAAAATLSSPVADPSYLPTRVA